MRGRSLCPKMMPTSLLVGCWLIQTRNRGLLLLLIKLRLLGLRLLGLEWLGLLLRQLTWQTGRQLAALVLLLLHLRLRGQLSLLSLGLDLSLSLGLGLLGCLSNLLLVGLHRALLWCLL